MKIAPLPAWNGFTPQWVEASGAHWLSKGPHIYRAESLGDAPGHVATVPSSAAKRFACALPFAGHYAERALRFSIYNLVPRVDGSLFVTFDRSMFVYSNGTWSQISGLVRACRSLRGCAAMTPQGDIFFGEYFPNFERTEPVNIYRLPAGASKAEIVHTWQPGEVRHVHGVHLDKSTGEIWSLTGDLPDECRVMKTADGFKTMQMVGTGDESWRGIYPLFTSKSVFYATDAEFAENNIFRIDRATGARKDVTSIDGPSYYGAEVAGKAVYATTAELCPSQKKPEAVLWVVGDGDAPARLAAWRKDLFANLKLTTIFQAGIVQFPSSQAPLDQVPFTGSGLKGLNGKMFVLG